MGWLPVGRPTLRAFRVPTMRIRGHVFTGICLICDFLPENGVWRFSGPA